MSISDVSIFTDTVHGSPKEKNISPPPFRKKESNFQSSLSFKDLKWLQGLSMGYCMHAISGIHFSRIQTEQNQDTGVYALMPRENQECHSYF